MSELDDHILARFGESVLLAAQALPTSSPSGKYKEAPEYKTEDVE